MIRVGFTLISGKDWTGGYNYLLNLLTLLAKYKRQELTPVLFVAESLQSDEFAEFTQIPGLELVRTELLNPERKSRSLMRALIFGRDALIVELFKRHQVDVVFEVAQFYGWRLGIPSIAWMTDFQHRVMPELFSKSAWFKRDFGFRLQIWGGRCVMLSSDDARATCEASYPSSIGRTRTVHFAVPSGPVIEYEQARKVADSYGLPEKFIFLPNQFWRHKNHGLVLKALNILRKRGVDIVIAATGKQKDLRDPNYFPQLEAEVKAKNLQGHIRLLGLVPYPHLAMLMRASSALLNPSLFEGWSTTVEEARSMGVPMLLSDLAVHREQMGEDAQYFSRHDPESLANALEQIVPRDMQLREGKLQEARQASDSGVRQFAHAFFQLAVDCQTLYRNGNARR